MQPENSWQVQLDQDGELIWVSGEETLTRQLAQSCWLRFQDVFLLVFFIHLLILFSFLIHLLHIFIAYSISYQAVLHGR